MRTTPTDPTAALAALISANHGVVVRRKVIRAESTGDRSATSRRTGGAFVAPMAFDIGALEFGEAFDLDAEALRMIDWGSAGTPPFERTVSAQAIVLFLVVVRTSDPALASAEFRTTESKAIAELEVAMRRSPALRTALLARRMRAVAVALETGSRRVHWLGEHPRQADLLRADR